MNKSFLESGKEVFLKLFPPPHLLTLPAFGLNISDHSVKIMELVRSGDIKIGKHANKAIPDDVIKSGNINKKEVLKEIMSSLRKEYKLSFVRVSIPEEKAYVFKTKVPNLDDESQIRSSIEFQLEDNVPLSLSEAIFDYRIIPGSKTKKRDIEVSVFVLPQKIVVSYLSLLKDAGLTPISFEIEAESIARAVVKKEDMETYMIVDYGRTRTGFSVVNRGVVQYTSTVETGGDAIDELLRKNSDMGEKEIEKFKNEKGLIKDEENPETYMSLANVVSVLKDEISKRFIFWHTHKDMDGKTGERIKKIILVGGNSNLHGLDDYLSSSLKVKVERGNVWANLSFKEGVVPDIGFNKSLSYASAVGLASRDFGDK